MLHGPFYHQINKGGLEAILATQRLLSTTASNIAGGGEAVRASRVKENAPTDFLAAAGDKAVIEFFSEKKPDDHTAPWIAIWSMPEGSHLDILVTRIRGADGHITSIHPAIKACGCCWNWAPKW